MDCQLKDVAAADALMIACVGALALLTIEIAFVVLMDFVDRMKNKKAQRMATPARRSPGPC